MLWFKHPDAVIPNLLLLTYLVLAYPLALVGMSSWVWFAPSLLLFANVLVLCAYLLHDCLHNNVFVSTASNERLGKVLAWLVGAVYSPYSALRDKHFRHHIERADILAVNYAAVLQRHPTLERCVQSAARWGLPAVDVLLQCLELLAPFYLPQRRHLRARTLCMLATRVGLFALLYYFSPLTTAGCVAAYLLFLWVLAFMDAFQHTYDVHYRLLGPAHSTVRDRHYEEQNTFSNLLSSRFPLLNLLVLNFCYHNVHHQTPTEPWYRLPALHNLRYPDGCEQLVPLSKQWVNFHRFRLDRIHPGGADTGANGVSFLVGI